MIKTLTSVSFDLIEGLLHVSFNSVHHCYVQLQTVRASNKIDISGTATVSITIGLCARVKRFSVQWPVEHHSSLRKAM